MKIYYTDENGNVTAWVEQGGKRAYEASAYSLEMAVGRLVYALSQRDDPKAEPSVIIEERKG
jgi:ribosomal protein S11